MSWLNPQSCTSITICKVTLASKGLFRVTLGGSSKPIPSKLKWGHTELTSHGELVAKEIWENTKGRQKTIMWPPLINIVGPMHVTICPILSLYFDIFRIWTMETSKQSPTHTHPARTLHNRQEQLQDHPLEDSSKPTGSTYMHLVPLWKRTTVPSLFERAHKCHNCFLFVCFSFTYLIRRTLNSNLGSIYMNQRACLLNY